MLHRVIPVQPRNLVKIRNLAHFGSILWPLNDAALEKRERVGPGLSLAHPGWHKGALSLLQLAKAGPRSWQTLLFAFHDGSPKLPFQRAEAICVLFRESKMLELNQLPTTDYPAKAAVPCSGSYTTQHNDFIKILAAFVCVWERSTPVHFLN